MFGIQFMHESFIGDPWAFSHDYAIGNLHILWVMNLPVSIFVDTSSDTTKLIFVSLKLTLVHPLQPGAFLNFISVTGRVDLRALRAIVRL
jgi:hypothetical protein